MENKNQVCSAVLNGGKTTMETHTSLNCALSISHKPYLVKSLRKFFLDYFLMSSGYTSRSSSIVNSFMAVSTVT